MKLKSPSTAKAFSSVILNVVKDLASLVVAARCFALLNMTIFLLLSVPILAANPSDNSISIVQNENW
jgi:hypothetical protein